MKPIAHIENDFPTKFGIPRQSGLVNSLHARIVMEPESVSYTHLTLPTN